MNLYQTLITAIRELALHKFRSALATLGVIFGVASVMAMLSIGEGARKQTLERIQILGLDNLLLRTVKPTQSAAKAEGQSRSGTPEYGLTRNDFNHIKNTFSGIRYAVPGRLARQGVRSSMTNTALDLSVLATEPDYVKATRSQVVKGRFFTASDTVDKRMICVLGTDAARKIFTFADPMGQTVRIGADWYEVVGLLRNSANLKESGGDDINNVIFIPLATSQARYGDLSINLQAGSYDVAKIELDSLILQVEKEEDVEPTARRLGVYFARAHKDKDYDLLVPRDLMNQKAATQRIFTVVMGSIASISLLVGGIGIMNIMLANVSDRRREIGTRRALGARRLDIVRQFLLEAAALTTAGGLVGVALGYTLSRSISSYADWPVTVSLDAILLGLAVSCASGLLFGFWPAWQAAKVNPIEALRSS